MYLQATNAGSDYMLSVCVYTGTRGALNQVDTNFNGSGMAFSAHAGTRYYFYIAGWFGSSGNLVFALNGNHSLRVSVTLDASDDVDQKTGVATVHGTLACSRAALVYLSGNMQQPVGRVNIITGAYSINALSCSGMTTWSATVTPSNGKFAGGKATATANVSASDKATGESANASATASIQLNSKK
jgi:hypothetical protein